MADISKIVDTNGNEYNLKDAQSREAIENIVSINASFVGTALVLETVSGLDNAEEVGF